MPEDESFFSQTQSRSTGETVAIRIIIEGRVQKVGLRHWIKQEAVRHKVYGWVRNRMNDTVEAFLYGPDEAVNEIIKICHQGPSFAHVKRIKEFPQSDVENIPQEFIILPTI